MLMISTTSCVEAARRDVDLNCEPELGTLPPALARAITYPSDYLNFIPTPAEDGA
jgi:hypothetical protein